MIESCHFLCRTYYTQVKVVSKAYRNRREKCKGCFCESKGQIQIYSLVDVVEIVDFTNECGNAFEF